MPRDESARSEVKVSDIDAVLNEVKRLTELTSDLRAERDALKAKIGNFEDDANRWRWLADTTLWTCELNQYSGPSAREYLWSTRFSAPYHEGNGGLIGAIDAARKE
jgi:hypothetical protein